MPPTSKNPPAAWADQVEIFPAWAPCPNGLVPNIGNGGQMCSNFNGDTDDMGIYIYRDLGIPYLETSPVDPSWLLPNKWKSLLPHKLCPTDNLRYLRYTSVAFRGLNRTCLLAADHAFYFDVSKVLLCISKLHPITTWIVLLYTYICIYIYIL